MPKTFPVTLSDILKAHNRIKCHLHKTPVLTSSTFDQLYGRKFFFKSENLQKTGSFKARGALNAVKCLQSKSAENGFTGVVTHSSGNHGQALAWAAQKAGLRCAVVTPNNSPAVKLEAIKSYGAEVVMCQPTPTERQKTCDMVSEEKGYHFIPPYDHYDVIAGQGTIAVEFLEQIPELDAILVPASGGGMIAGIAIAAKAIKPAVKVYMVEPQGKDVQTCLEAGQRLWPNPPQFLDTIADGIRLQQLGHVTWPIILQLVEKDVFTVITIHYKSGIKSRVINHEVHNKICKLIFHNRQVEKGILHLLKSTSPNELVAEAATVVANECKDLCKRNSGSVLQDRSHAGILTFSWDKFHKELQIRAPCLLMIVSTMISDIPVPVPSTTLCQVLFTVGLILHGRFREMTAQQYLVGMVLLHGGCTHKDIERLSKVGVTVRPDTIQDKLSSWQGDLDEELIKLRDMWSNEGELMSVKYQLVGDNWDKNILPSYRTSDRKTQSLHLFHVIGVVDRVPVDIVTDSAKTESDLRIEDVSAEAFIPSVEDQTLLLNELTFMVAWSVIQNVEQVSSFFENIYPKHLQHKYSDFAGEKTKQFPLGLYDCDEKRTQDMIKLLKDLTDRYVPKVDGEIVAEVFFGGDRLTDERVQVAQQAMANAETSAERLEGFISKIEDFHRSMNFLEAIYRMTYSTSSSRDRGTMYYYRNLLNARNVKGDVKNSFRAYKYLYYTVFDGICCVLFYLHFGINATDEMIPFPDNFAEWSNDHKIKWLNDIITKIVTHWLFDGSQDMLEDLRDVLNNPEHDDNYWVNTAIDGRFKCHLCEKSYKFLGSLKTHEKLVHDITVNEQHVTKKTKTKRGQNQDELKDYLICLFRLVALHKNLDSAIDMADGHRSVRSAKYETPIYNKTNKIKYLIGSVHLTGMCMSLPFYLSETLIANRCINISGGKNNNLALDEYVEILNRDTKDTCTGHQTKDSIIHHSKEYPHLIDAVKHVDQICSVTNRKGFHKVPSYKPDVAKVVKDLQSIDAFTEHLGRSLNCRDVVQHKNPYHDSHKQLATMIFRHKPVLPFRRLRNKHM